MQQRTRRWKIGCLEIGMIHVSGRGLSTAARGSVALAHATWFHLPEQGMKAAELLAQGSGFVTRMEASSTAASYAVVSAHVAAPHRWRGYYPSADYLAYVKDKHCETRLGWRALDGCENGAAILRAPLVRGFAHSELDVACFAADGESSAGAFKLRTRELTDGEKVYIHGHVLRGVDGADGVVPTRIDGLFLATDGARAFARTEHKCELGMCGGPVLDADGLVVGMLEGVVPELTGDAQPKSKLHKKVSGSAAFITAQELCSFLQDVERTDKGATA